MDYEFLRREEKMHLSTAFSNTITNNPNALSVKLIKDSELEIKDKDSKKVFHRYTLSSSAVFGVSKVHALIRDILGLNIFDYNRENRYNLQFICNKKHDILAVNKLLERVVFSEDGLKYFDIPILKNAKCFKDKKDNYYKIYDVYRDIEEEADYVIYQEIFGKYEFIAERFDKFFNRLNTGQILLARDIVNHKHSLYVQRWLVRKMKKWAKVCMATAAEGSEEYRLAEDDYTFMSNNLKEIKQSIKKIKESEK